MHVGGIDEGEIPEFIVVKTKPKASEIRILLREMEEKGADEDTVKLFAALAVTRPAMRLAGNMHTMLEILKNRPIKHILSDGLMAFESEALVDLDRRYFSEASREVAHSLLNVKERWIMFKTISGVFRRFRNMEGGFLNLSPEDDNHE